jgi:hypothetical protein
VLIIGKSLYPEPGSRSDALPADHYYGSRLNLFATEPLCTDCK